MEERRLLLQEAGLHNDEDVEEEFQNGQESRLDVIGEELSEKEEEEEEEEIEEEEEVERHQDEDLDRSTQDC